MHRSSSYLASSSGGCAAGMDHHHLPTYDPQSDAAKKEALDASRAHLAETLVHLIPLVIVACGLLLWSFSSTPEVGIMVEKKGSKEKMVAHIHGVLPRDGLSVGNWNGSGMMTGMEDLDPIDKVHGVVSVEDDSGVNGGKMKTKRGD